MRPHSEAYTSSSFLQHFPELVLARKGNLANLCARANLDQESILGSAQLIPFTKFIDLLEITAEQLNFPDISLALANRQDSSILGPISALLLDCKDAPDAMDKIIKSIPLLVSNIEFKLIENANNYELRFMPSLPDLQDRPQFQIYLLASAALLQRELAGHSVPLRGCFFTFEEHNEENIKHLSRYFGCPMAFGAQGLALTTGKDFIESSAEEISQNIRQRIHSQLESRKNISEQVSHVVMQCMINGNANLHTVSAALGYSSRTLHRRLESSGTSFNRLLDANRLQLANHYLANHYYTLADIAQLLGYKNLSAFSRSYKRWCGITPSKSRELTKSATHC